LIQTTFSSTIGWHLFLLYFGPCKNNKKANGEHIRHAKGSSARFEGGKRAGKSKEGLKFSTADAIAIRSFNRSERAKEIWEQISKNIKQRIPHCSFAESENAEYP
jgi:hypothetical protein